MEIRVSRRLDLAQGRSWRGRGGQGQGRGLQAGVRGQDPAELGAMGQS